MPAKKGREISLGFSHSWAFTFYQRPSWAEDHWSRRQGKELALVQVVKRTLRGHL